MIHDINVPPDERAAAEAIYRRTTSHKQEDLNPAEEARTLARIALGAARPKMWLQLQDDLERLEEEVKVLRSHLTGGMCPACGSRFAG